MNGASDLRAGMRSILTKGGKDLSAGAAGITGNMTTALGVVANNSGTAALAMVAVDAGVEALRLGYASIEDHKRVDKEAYDLFVQDYNTGTVSFFLPTNPSERTGSQRFFDHFIQLFQNHENGRNSDLFRRAGIHYTDNVEVTKPGIVRSSTIRGTSYSLISSAAVIFAGEYDYARDEDSVLDNARHGSDLFLIAKLPMMLEQIFSYKSHDPREYTLTTGKLSLKVLHRLDLVRFMTLVFANLLINLQHAPDLDSDAHIPLNDPATVALCESVKELITTIRLYESGENQDLSYLNDLYIKDMFFKFLDLLKSEVEDLQLGYQSKILNQLSLSDLIAQCHGILQGTNTLWFQLLYLDKPLSRRDQLLLLVRELSKALDNHADFWTQLPQIFREARISGGVPNIAGLNAPYCTVMDLIGLFAALSTEQREAVLLKLPETYVGIKGFLQQLNQSFIEPLKEELRFISDNATHAFLLNLIALSAESRPPFLRESSSNPPRPSVKKQLSDLNDAQMQQSSTSLAFTWGVWDCFADQLETSAGAKKRTPTRTPTKSKFKPDTILLQRAMLSAEYGFLDAVRSVCALQELLASNKSLLLHSGIRSMLRKVLVSLRDREVALKNAIQRLYNHVNTQDKIHPEEKDGDSNRRRQYILHALSEGKGLGHRSQYVKDEIDRTITILDSPEFTDRTRQSIETEVASVMYVSHAEFAAEKNQLLAALQLPVLPQVIVQPDIGQRTARSSVAQVVADSSQNSGQSTQVGSGEINTTPIRSFSNSVPTQGLERPSTIDAPPPDANLRLHMLLRIMRAVSAFLLIVGLLVLLSLTFGAPYLTAIAALTTQQIATGTLLGCMSSVGGGVGLGLSYFFKPAEAGRLPENVSTTVAAAQL